MRGVVRSKLQECQMKIFGGVWKPEQNAVTPLVQILRSISRSASSRDQPYPGTRQLPKESLSARHDRKDKEPGRAT